VAKRLREARERKGISQRRLGILAGMDEFSASPRINQYERDRHVPDFSVAKRLARALGVPVTYLYAEDDQVAELILLFTAATKPERKTLVKKLRRSATSDSVPKLG